MSKGYATRPIEEGTVSDRKPKPATNGRKPSGSKFFMNAVRSHRPAGRHGHISGAMQVGATEVTFDTPHDAIGFQVAADLTAANEPAITDGGSAVVGQGRS